MSAGNSGKLTELLQQAGQGDTAARERLLEIAYPELHRIAAKRLRAENAGHTLQPTALVILTCQRTPPSATKPKQFSAFSAF